MCQPASGAAVDIVGILQTGHPLFQPHDLSCFIIICQLLQLGSNENFEVKQQCCKFDSNTSDNDTIIKNETKKGSKTQNLPFLQLPRSAYPARRGGNLR